MQFVVVNHAVETRPTYGIYNAVLGCARSIFAMHVSIDSAGLHINPAERKRCCSVTPCQLDNPSASISISQAQQLAAVSPQASKSLTFVQVCRVSSAGARRSIALLLGAWPLAC